MLLGKTTEVLYATVNMSELSSKTEVPHRESGPGTLGAFKPASRDDTSCV